MICDFVRSIVLLQLVVFAAVTTLSVRTVAGREMPNIVFILADDQTFTDYGFMGNARVHTPNLDELASRSARFVNGYNTTSVCRPSLATLLTGLYPHQHGIHFNHGPPGNAGYNRMESRREYEQTRRREFELIRRVSRMPDVLARTQGYRCLQTGKFWEGHWRSAGFTEGMTLFEAPDKSMTFGGLRVLKSGDRVAHGNGDNGLAIGRLTMEPIYEFIADCESEDTPWMVWYAPYLPHQPHDSPQRFFDLANRRPGVKPHELPYFASIAQFDDTVGKLVQFVESIGAAEETLFIYLSDNGWSPSRTPQRNRPQEFAHTKESKRSPFEDGLRTPILLRWDGVIEPHTYQALVSAIDVVPTIYSAVGVDDDTLLRDLPGKELISVARRDASLRSDRAVFGAVYPGDATSLNNPAGDVAYRWVRQGKLKLIVPHKRGKNNAAWGGYLNQVSLFDVVADVKETKNLAADPKYVDERARLSELLNRWWDARPIEERP